MPSTAWICRRSPTGSGRKGAAGPAPESQCLPRVPRCRGFPLWRLSLPASPVFPALCPDLQRMRGEWVRVSRISVVFWIPVRAGRGSFFARCGAQGAFVPFAPSLSCAKVSRNAQFFCKGLLLFKALHGWDCPICPGKTEAKNSDTVSCRRFCRYSREFRLHFVQSAHIFRLDFVQFLKRRAAVLCGYHKNSDLLSCNSAPSVPRHSKL